MGGIVRGGVTLRSLLVGSYCGGCGIRWMSPSVQCEVSIRWAWHRVG